MRLLRGTESDILADGAPRLSRTRSSSSSTSSSRASTAATAWTRDQMTERLVRAMAHPCFKIWGHALGRSCSRARRSSADVEEVLDAVGRVPRRDRDQRRSAPARPGAPLDPRRARARHLASCVSTDAHSIGELGNVRYGVAMARRGWVRRDEVLNTLSAAEFARAVAPAGPGEDRIFLLSPASCGGAAGAARLTRRAPLRPRPAAARRRRAHRSARSSRS